MWNTPIGQELNILMKFSLSNQENHQLELEWHPKLPEPADFLSAFQPIILKVTEDNAETETGDVLQETKVCRIIFFKNYLWCYKKI